MSSNKTIRSALSGPGNELYDEIVIHGQTIAGEVSQGTILAFLIEEVVRLRKKVEEQGKALEEHKRE